MHMSFMHPIVCHFAISMYTIYDLNMYDDGSISICTVCHSILENEN